MPQPPRRVVAAIDADGRSCIASDGPAAPVIWTSDASPADNANLEDAGGRPFTFDIPGGGTQFTYADFPPRSEGGMHATDTLDMGVIVSGAVTFVTETGEAALAAGDVIIDRGIMHRWRNDGDDPCRIVLVNIPAHPVGKGATVRGVVQR